MISNKEYFLRSPDRRYQDGFEETEMKESSGSTSLELEQTLGPEEPTCIFSWLCRKCSGLFQVRVLVGFLMFLGTLTSYMLRVNLNIAIVQMTDDQEGLCTTSTEAVVNQDGNIRFCWSEWQKSWIKGSFFYGYVVMQVFGGSLAEKFGTKVVLGTANTLTAIMTLVIPLVAKLDWRALIALRVLQVRKKAIFCMYVVFLMLRHFQGLAESVTYPCLPPMIMRWAPVQERSKFITFTYMGGTVGTLVTYPLCGLLLRLYDWEYIYYFGGAFGLGWLAMWSVLVSDDPKNHCFISTKERTHILESRQQTMGQIGACAPPYLEILQTPTVWIAMFCDFANSIASYMIIIEGPNFIKNILNQDIKSNGLLSAVPHAATMIYGIAFGILADYILSKGWLQKKNVRKLMHGIGFGLPAVTAAVLGYTTANWILCITVLSLGFGFRAAQYAGHYSLIYDIAPKFSGTVYGMVNMCGNTAGFLTPMLTSAMTAADPKDPNGWRHLFWISSGLLLAGFFVFIAYVKFEVAEFEYRDEECRPSNKTKADI